MILVAGSTGVLGSEICRLLAAGNRKFRALVRTTSDGRAVEHLRFLGGEIFFGDLKDAGSLRAACEGVETVISTVTTIVRRQEGDSFDSVDIGGHRSLIAAAKESGVSHFIFVSAPDMGLNFPLNASKRAIEDMITASGIAYTILQPTCFMEIWLSPMLGFDVAAGRARILGMGENKTSLISIKDVARFVEASLDAPAARNAVIELGGPEDLSGNEVVSIFEEVTGKRFEREYVPDEDLISQYEAANDPVQQSFAGLMLYAARGCVIDMSRTMKEMPIERTSVREFAISVAGVGSVANG